MLIEDTAAWKILWPSINPAGAVLIGTEIAGYWRPKKTGPKLTLTVTGFRRFTTAERTAILDEAQLVGSARAVDSVDLVFA